MWSMECPNAHCFVCMACSCFVSECTERSRSASNDMEYSVPVWAPHKQKHIDTTEKVQRQAARGVSKARQDNQQNCWSTSYSCHNFQWLTLHQWCLLLCQCQTFKIIHSIDCIKFSDYFAFESRTLRSHPYSLAIFQSCINAFRFSHFVNAPFIWNQLPPSILQSSSLYTFQFASARYR